MSRFINRGETANSPADAEELPDTIPTTREMLAAAGVRFDFIAGGDIPAPPALDDEGLIKLAVAARQRLEQTRQIVD